MPKYVHHMIRDTAKAIAGEVYEIWASKHSDWYKENRDQKAYIEANWDKFVEAARESLATTLREGKLPDEVKQTIAEALILDNTIRPSRHNQIRIT